MKRQFAVARQLLVYLDQNGFVVKKRWHLFKADWYETLINIANSLESIRKDIPNEFENWKCELFEDDKRQSPREFPK